MQICEYTCTHTHVYKTVLFTQYRGAHEPFSLTFCNCQTNERPVKTLDEKEKRNDLSTDKDH